MTNTRVKRNTIKLLPFLIAVISWLAAEGNAGATIYSYTDAKGIVHFTNVPANPRYKAIIGPLGSKPSQKAGRNDRQYRPFILSAAKKHGIDPNIIKAIIKAESDFDRYALSPKGARGLMQLMPETAKDMRVFDSYNPKENIYGGTKYFKKLYDIFNGDLKLALASYNAGLSKVLPTKKIPEIKETRQYVDRVLKYYESYRSRIP